MNKTRHGAFGLIAHASQRPLAKFGLILGAIFVLELAVHTLGIDVPGWAGALLDATAITALAALVMWPLLVRPLRVALETEQARAQVILDTASDAIITIDDRGRMQALNRAARVMFGVSAQDAIGRNVNILVPSPHHERHDSYLEHYRRTGERHVIGSVRRLEAVRKDGEIFPMELSVTEGWSGGRRFFTAMIRDITERIRTEDRLQKLSHAVEQSPAATVITDTSGRIEYVNPRFCEITGYSEDELIGKTPALIKSGATPPEVYADLWRTILSGKEWRGDMQNRRKSGELYWEHEIISSVKNEQGEIVNFIAVKEDINERKRAEEALQEKNSRLLEAERELRKAHESLAESARLESVGRLAAGVAHEVRNPLTIIRLGIDYFSGRHAQQGDREVIEEVRGAVDRADYVVRDLLDFSRPRAFAPRPIDVDKVIDTAVQLTKHEMEHRNIAMVRTRGVPMPPIYADADRLVQVFINLLTNAAQAIGKDGSIEMVTRMLRLSERELARSEPGLFGIGEPVVAIDVRDSGPGVPAEHKKYLFDPFFTTKAVGEGTGIGLAVSRSIVIMHGGSIDISNRSEGGASALLLFRAAAAQLTE